MPILPFRPSPEQQKVINYRGGDLQVIACAGSGKTESISRRVAELIAEGAEPASIIAFTFTERAAAELKERIVRRVEERMGKEFLGRLGPMYVGTIHGYCFRMLQDNVPYYGNYDVLDENRHAGILNRERKNLGLEKLNDKVWGSIEGFSKTVDVIGNELIDAKVLKGTPIGECYEAYCEMLDRYHFLTFSRIIACAVDALEDPSIFKKVHTPLKYLVVDEYQDINPAQERLIKLLATNPVELCVVGDDDQSIYQWRGSDVSNILEFMKRRKKASALKLLDNRRSRPGIVGAANIFSASIPDRLDKEMQPVRKKGPNELVCWKAENPAAEAARIADTIENLHKLGYAYSDMAVLCRSVRTSAPNLITELTERRIPLSCAGRTGLFQQPEIHAMGELYAWVVDRQWQDEAYGPYRQADIDQVIVALNRSFGLGKPIPGLKKFLEDWKKLVLSGTRPISLVGDYYQILFKLGVAAIAVDTPSGNALFGALARFSQLLADFEHVNRRGRYEGEGAESEFKGGMDRGRYYMQNLAGYLLHYARDAYEDFAGEETAGLDAVNILTIHQAKGLEWPIVFMPALVKGRFPSQFSGRAQKWLLPAKAFPADTQSRYEGGDAEERRLFYVGMTRARDALYLSCFEKKTRAFQPSPYLLEVAGKKKLLDAELPLPGAPEKTGEPKTPPLQISFSEVASYDDCGHAYRLSAAFGFQQQIAVELGYGKAIHHVLRQVAETARDSGKIPTPKDLEQLVLDEFYLPFANKPAFQTMISAARRLVGNYVENHASDLRRIWATERPFEIHLQDGIVSGRADVIFDEEKKGKKGSLAIVDYKVAKDEEREDRYRYQLAVYAAAGRGEGLTVDAAYLHELKDSERKSVDIGEAVTKQAVERLAKSVKGIREGAFVPAPEGKKCTGCEYKRVCNHRHAKTQWD